MNFSIITWPLLCQSCRSLCKVSLLVYFLFGVAGWCGIVVNMLSLFKMMLRYFKPCARNKLLSSYLLLLVCSFLTQTHAIGDIVWAVNSGGEAHTDVHGIYYEKDMLGTGISSDYGKTLQIARVVQQDQILYQTERYHISNFGYELPLRDDGDYVLVLKFCEVWFTSPNQKVIIIFYSTHCKTPVTAFLRDSRLGRGHKTS